MTKVLFCGIDGLELSYLDEFGIPFWNEIKDDASIVKIPKPKKIESGDIGVASSPRLWARYNTGAPPKINGVAGFWEKYDEDGNVHRANVDVEWMRKTRCEKLVDREDLLVDPIWSVLLRNNKEIGIITPWFSYPIQDWEKDNMGSNSFALTDFPFPREDLNPEKNFYPPDAEPPNSFEDQVGAGARIPLLIQDNPRDLVRRMKKQDEDRYDYAQDQLTDRTPDFVGLYLRAVDGMQHILHNQEKNWTREGGFVQEGETIDEAFTDPKDLKDVYEINMEEIKRLWNTGKFDVLVIASDHGSDVLNGGDAHSWPAYSILYSEDETMPTFSDLRGKYEDLCPTILDLLDVEVPDYMTGDSLLAQAEISENLRNLGYF